MGLADLYGQDKEGAWERLRGLQSRTNSSEKNATETLCGASKIGKWQHCSDYLFYGMYVSVC
jgi:hypothetical protein